MEDFLLNKTILIVDDTPENIDVLQGLLADFKKKVATSGERALKIALSDNPPDLILLDIMMPEMDGYEVCRRLRKDERTKDVPVIFLSAKTAKEDIVNGLLVGGQDYVTKPFDSHELMERVKTQLELRHQKELLKNMNVVLEEKVQERTAQLNESNIKLEIANKKLVGLDEAKNNFLNLISHEIRTPLNGIVGSTYFLNDMIEDPELKEFVEMLMESVDRLDGFSKKALEITQMQTLGDEIKKKEIHINKLVNDGIEASKENANNKNIEFEISLIDEDGILGVEDYISGAIKEIIGNAIKFSNENNVVKVVSVVKGDKFKLSISDTGEVIPKEKIEEIVKPFGLGNAHYDKHMGLGLSYVQSTIDLHNAAMEISSNENLTTVSMLFKIG